MGQENQFVLEQRPESHRRVALGLQPEGEVHALSAQQVLQRFTFRPLHRQDALGKTFPELPDHRREDVLADAVGRRHAQFELTPFSQPHQPLPRRSHLALDFFRVKKQLFTRPA